MLKTLLKVKCKTQVQSYIIVSSYNWSFILTHFQKVSCMLLTTTNPTQTPAMLEYQQKSWNAF